MGNDDDKPRGELVLFDDSNGYAIYWNGAATFNVWSVLGNSFSFRALREVNVFTSYGVTDTTEAQQTAQEWWDTYGRENTAELEREGL